MAILDGDAIHTAIRDRITGRLSTPSVRAIPVGYFSCDLPEGTNDVTAAIRALPSPIAGRRVRPVVTVTVGMKLSAQTPAGPGNVTIWDLTPTLRAYYNLGNPAESERNYQKVRGQVVSDADMIAESLMWPGALTQTAAATTTGIVSGILRLTEGMRVSREAPDGAGDILVAELNFRGIARASPATT